MYFIKMHLTNGFTLCDTVVDRAKVEDIIEASINRQDVEGVDVFHYGERDESLSWSLSADAGVDAETV